MVDQTQEVVEIAYGGILVRGVVKVRLRVGNLGSLDPFPTFWNA